MLNHGYRASAKVVIIVGQMIAFIPKAVVTQWV
jgi:hypothetical protein